MTCLLFLNQTQQINQNYVNPTNPIRTNMAETGGNESEKKFTFKVQATNMNDLIIATNDTETADKFCKWYSEITGKDVKPQKGSTLIKTTSILDNARKDSALGSSWIVAVGDKLLELGYQPGFGAITLGAADQSFVFFTA